MKRYGVTLLAVVLAFSASSPAEAVTYKKFKNCTAVNKVYAHGIAKKGYKANASGLTGTPFVNTKLYNLNSSKDRDKDGVACEK